MRHFAMPFEISKNNYEIAVNKSKQQQKWKKMQLQCVGITDNMVVVAVDFPMDR